MEPVCGVSVCARVCARICMRKRDREGDREGERGKEGRLSQTPDMPDAAAKVKFDGNRKIMNSPKSPLPSH